MQQHRGSTLSRILLACLCCLVATSVVCAIDVQAQSEYTVACRADVDDNGVVDLMDLVAVATHYKPFVPTTAPSSDVNRDGYIDLFDLVLMSLSYREPCCLFATEAAQHYHEPRQCVEFDVKHTHREANEAFLDSAFPFDKHFYVYVGRGLWGCWTQMPDKWFAYKTIRVWGVIEYFAKYDAPQIKLQNCGDIEILD